MEVVAEISKDWKRRQVMIVAMLSAAAVWFWYDGASGWPAKNKAYDAFHALAEGEERDLEFRKMAEKNGWSPKPPEKRYSESDIRNQFLIAGALGLGAAAALGMLLASRGKRVVSDADGITDQNGQRLRWLDIVALDKKKWDRKSIAYAIYKTDAGERRFMLDDFKYAGCDLMVNHIEELLGLKKPADAPAEPAGSSPDPGTPAS